MKSPGFEILITNLKFKKNAVQAKECTIASCFGLRVLAFRFHPVEWGWGRQKPEEWDLGAGKGVVHGDDFREVMTLELGS